MLKAYRELHHMNVCICLHFDKLALKVCQISHEQFLFAVYPLVCRELSLDYFDTEENLKT